MSFDSLSSTTKIIIGGAFILGTYTLHKLFQGRQLTQLSPKSQPITQTYMNDKQYGVVKIQAFVNSWLKDFPQVLEHVESEHILHVKSLDDSKEGLTWHTDKFKTDMDPLLNPEARVGDAKQRGFQMKLAYFKVPAHKLETYKTLALSSQVKKEFECDENGKTYYRFFVHPQAYEHFRSLHDDPEITFIPSEKSEFMGTPTSSYRSWIVRQVENREGVNLPKANSIPFVVKLGVAGSILGSDRWLSPNEIERSVQAQVAFDAMPTTHFVKNNNGSDFAVFPESCGLVLKNVTGYPPKSNEVTKESGELIRELPKELLEGKCRILSLAALMSPERAEIENEGLCSQDAKDGTERLPLIYQVMAATIKKGIVKTPEEFVHQFLIKKYLEAIEQVVFQEGLTIEPHSQNLLMILNNDYTPRGFAYRDHGGIWVDVATRGLQNKDISAFYRKNGDSNRIFKSKGAISKGYIGSFSWFYRYQVFIKMLNTITHLSKGSGEIMRPPVGAPIQIGHTEKLPERNLRKHIRHKIKSSASDAVYRKSKTVLDQYSLTLEQYNKAISLLDEAYLTLMNRYFDLEKVAIPLDKGALPSAEGGSSGDKLFLQHKGFLGKYRFNKLDSTSRRILVSNISSEVFEKIKDRIITSFENETLLSTNAKECIIAEKGVCFLNENQDIVAFMPYTYPGEKEYLERKLMADQPIRSQADVRMSTRSA